MTLTVKERLARFAVSDTLFWLIMVGSWVGYTVGCVLLGMYLGGVR